jgi:membrane-bound serine protease (ClpP class)
MSLEIIIVIYIVSLLILIIEVFVPSGGILAIAGVGGLSLGIYFGFQTSVLLGGGQLIVAIVVVPLLFLYGIKKLTLNKTLPDEEGFRSEKKDLSYLINKQGVALTNLRPSGTIIMEGKRYDVVTEGEMINKDRPVMVVKIEGARIVVKSTPIA